MSTVQPADEAPGTAPALRLALGWADFTKALSIYPATNARVRDKLQEALTLIAEIRKEASKSSRFDRERGITVLFRDDVVCLGSLEETIPEGSQLAWLRQRLAHAGIAGAEFMDDVNEQSLLDFTAQLLKNFLRKEPDVSFESFWPDDFPGIVLVDRRFEGSFGGNEIDGRFIGGHSGTTVERAKDNRFVQSLMSHPKISNRLMRLQSAIASLDRAEEETLEGSELVKRIMDDVSAEALVSRDALIVAVCNAMDLLMDRATEEATSGDGSGGEGSQFAALLYEVSRSHFGRKGPGMERLAVDAEAKIDAPSGGRKRDGEIDDDVHALLAEVQALPARLSYDLDAGDADSAPEQLAVLLHYLVHLDQPESLAGLYPSLGKLLENPGAQEHAVLRKHLTVGSDDPEVARARRQALVQYMTVAGKAHLLRACGLLTPEFVLEDLGRRLPLFLSALDFTDPSSIPELNEICARAGDLQILAAGPSMATAIRALPRSQVAGAFLKPHRARLALARTLIAFHPESLRQECALFLRAVDLPEDENFLLYELEDLEFLSVQYMTSLIDLHLGQSDPDTVRRHVVDCLCLHIRSVGDVDPSDASRIKSIRQLARYPSANGWFLLQELGKTFFGPFGGKEPALVRKTAKAVAAEYRAADAATPDAAPVVPTAAPKQRVLPQIGTRRTRARDGAKAR